MSKRFGFLAVCVGWCLFILSCGGGKSTTTSGSGSQTTGIQFTAPASSPTIELGQTVALAVSSADGSVTWTLQNAKGNGKVQGTLTTSGTTATYAAPPVLDPPPSCNASAAPPSPLSVNVVATDSGGNSANLPITILQGPPCVGTAPSLQACVATSAATTCTQYPTPSSTSFTCPANGTLIPPGTNGIQPFQVGVYNSIPIYDGGGNTGNSPTPFGEAPFTWSVSSGTLPAGLQILPGNNSAGIFIGGTPTSAGCTSFTLQITDALGEIGIGQFFIVVVPPGLKIQSPNTVASAQGGISYPTTAFHVLGGQPPYAWTPSLNAFSVNPNSPEDLPPGLNLSFPQNSTAVISGAPDTADIGNSDNGGTYSIFLQVNDSQLPYPALATANLTSIAVGLPNTLCLPANDLTPTSGYGGSATGGNVAIDAFLQGSYAFLLHGFDANGPVAIAGSVQTDGLGNILGGEEDVTRSGGSQTVNVLPSSSYNMGGERNRGCMTIKNSSGTTSTFAFTVGSCTNNYTKADGTIGPDASACGITANDQGVNVPAGLYGSGRMVEYDNSGSQLTGILRMQDNSSFTSGLSGQYAFGLSGSDAAAKHYAAAGSLQASSGSFSSAAADINDGGTLASNLTGGSGTIAAADANGRAAANLTVGPSSFGLALYMVSQTEVMAATTDLLDTTHPIASGEAITSVAGPFSTASLQNSHMFHLAGLAGTLPDANIGVLHFDGIAGFTGTVYENQAATLGTITVSGSYGMDSNTGRTAFQPSQTNQDFAHPFVAYIIPPSASLTTANCGQPANCVTGFLVGTDSVAQDGILEFQTPSVPPPPPFSNKYILGDYTFGVDEALDNLTTDSEGFTVARASASSLTAGTLNGTQDFNYSDPNYCQQSHCTPLIPEEQWVGSFTINTDGTGSFGGFNTETVSVSNGRTVFYFDQSPLNLHPVVIVGEQ